MATKDNPGAFDCYANAKHDEPLFILLARDQLAPAIVRVWAAGRENNALALQAAIKNLVAECVSKFQQSGAPVPEKIIEALTCAHAMEVWKRENPDV